MSNTVIVDTSIVIKWMIEEPDLALAERENCEYWTADVKLLNATSKKLTWVRNLHDVRDHLSEE